MADYDAPIPFDDEPSPQEQQLALAQALRARGQGQAPMGGDQFQQQQLLGLVGQLSGNPDIEKTGHGIVQGAQHGRELLDRLAQRKQEHEQLAQWHQDQLQQRQDAQDSLNQNRDTRNDLEAQAMKLKGWKLDPLTQKWFRPGEGQRGAGGAGSQPATGGGPKPAGPPPIPGGLSPDVVEDAAKYVNQSGGSLPPALKLPRGPLGVQISNFIMNRAHALRAPGGPELVETGASVHADTASLKQAQELADAMDRNEGKAKGDLQTFESTMGKMFDTGSPWLNKPARELQNASGSPDAAAFNAARLALVNQVNRVLSATSGGSALSDSSRKEAEELLNGNLTLPQMRAVIGVLVKDMGRSKAAMHQSVTDIRGRISGEKAAPGPEATPAASGSGLTIYDLKGNPFEAPNADVKAKALASNKYRETP